MAGFIGLDRGIREHWIYEDAEYLKVWFEILFCARFSYEPEKKLIDGKFITIEYGQFIFGRVSWSERLKVSEQRLRTLFKKLTADGMIELIQKSTKFSLYSVKNYAKYNQQSNHQQTQAGQGFEGDANQQSNNTSTITQPSPNHQLTTQEQGKQRKQSKQGIKKIHYAEFVQLTEEEYDKLVAEYGEEMTKECINILNTYKGSTGKKYKSDYMTMTPSSWVPKRYYEDQERKLRVVTGGQYLNGGGGQQQKQTAFSRLQQLAREEHEREASGNY